MLLDKQKKEVKFDLNEHSLQFLENDNSSDMLKAMEILQNPSNIESNTILSNEQVNGLTMMNWAGQVYDMDCFKMYANSFPRYRISGDDGRGRKEIIQIAEAIRKEKMEEHNRMLEIMGKK